VFITDGGGQAAFVLLSMQDYCALTRADKNIAGLRAMPDTVDFELPIPAREKWPAHRNRID
jgi:hypothetical protein